jgi:hypothetical protein
MKKLLLALAILVFATPLFAADAYVGLYTDANHGVCDLYLVGGFMPFDLWIWWIAPTVGVQAAEYRIVAPSYVILSTVTTNPDISVTLGDIVNGISVAFYGCNPSWVWTQKVLCYLTGPGPGFIQIDKRPDVDHIQIASCELGYPIYTAAVLNHLAIGQSCQIATEESSWGAIKSLF